MRWMETAYQARDKTRQRYHDQWTPRRHRSDRYLYRQPARRLLSTWVCVKPEIQQRLWFAAATTLEPHHNKPAKTHATPISERVRCRAYPARAKTAVCYRAHSLSQLVEGPCLSKSDVAVPQKHWSNANAIRSRRAVNGACVA